MDEQAVAAHQQRFGDLLRRLRRAAGLTQEALAERAGVSARAIADLERGVNQTPRRDTLQMLADALGLAAPERAVLDAVARRRVPTGKRPERVAAAAAEEPAPAAGAAADDPPSGILTFLLTGIEGSAALWERHPAAMRAALARHDALVDALLAQHGGRRARGGGEVVAVFGSPGAALVAACALQRALLAEPWPAEATLRVRMGLHTGEAEWRGDAYAGDGMNRAARIRSLGHGGQILLSRGTYELVRDALPDGVGPRALGSYVLEGLTRPEEVYQVLHASLPAGFPPLEGLQAPRSNLPAQLTSFIGRERERDEIVAQLGESRLVTLTGTGGAGKTRLALAAAADLLGAYPDGVWLVELAALTGTASGGVPLVGRAVAQALGVREEPGRHVTQTLIDHVKERHLLLVLDNCEHLVEACAELAADLLRACPRLRMLATSREGLEVRGERRWRVPSLTVPDPRRLPPPELAGSYEAVRLFVERAKERRTDFALTAQNARAVAQICARLDGIPLAIELAAARVGSLPVEAVAARLDDRFRLLTGGARDALPRQRTLRATLDWSHDLLGADEQRLLARLSVFAGGWTLEAAEAVCTGEGIATAQIPELLASLENRSLALLEEAGAAGELGRYRLLETVRQYAVERLGERREGAVVRVRHLGWYVSLAEEAEQQLRGPEQAHWLDRLEAEHDNLRAALGWAREQEAWEEGLRLAGALWRFWWTRGYLVEGISWLEAVIAGGKGSPAARAKALTGAGNLAWQQGDYVRAAALHEEALALRRALDDTRGIAASLHSLGIVAHQQGQFADAATLYEEALALCRALGDKAGMAGSLGNLGHVAHAQGDYARTITLVEEALALFRALSDIRNIAASLHLLGNVLHEQGENGRALAMHEEALALFREMGNTAGIAGSLNILGRVAFAQGDCARAGRLFEEGLQLCRTIGARDDLAEGLEGLAWVAAACGEPLRAVRIGGAAEALREALGVPLVLERRAAHERAVRAMRSTLGDAFTAAWAAGRALPLDQAIALALERHAEVSQGP